MKAMAIVATVCGVAFLVALAAAAWPRRRRVAVSARWVRNEETGLREYVATPWLQGERP